MTVEARTPEHRRRLALLLALLGSGLVGAPVARPLLWRAQKGGADGPTIHLLGSLHVGKPEFFPVHEKVAAAYAGADTCVFEIDLVQAKMPWQAARIMLRGRLGGGRSLRDVVSAETWSKLEACAAEVGLPMVMIEGLKPWMAAQMLLTTAILKAGYTPDSGTDLHFTRRALTDKKRIVPLETLGQQLDAIEKALAPLGEEVLAETIDELADLEKSFGRLVRSWREGDEKELAKLLEEMELGDAKAYETLVTVRNRNWLPILEKLAAAPLPPPEAPAEEPVPAPPAGPRHLLVVVGTGHLVGEGSLVELLREQGWKVERR